MRYQRILLFLLPVGLVLTSCARRLPDDLPKLYPCRVTVSLNDAPLDEAMVTFIAEETKWSAAGTTDADGVATMRTNGTYQGVAEGNYKVVVQKYKVVHRGEDVAPDEILLVDAKYSDPAKTTLACEIGPKANEIAFSLD